MVAKPNHLASNSQVEIDRAEGTNRLTPHSGDTTPPSHPTIKGGGATSDDGLKDLLTPKSAAVDVGHRKDDAKASTGTDSDIDRNDAVPRPDRRRP